MVSASLIGFLHRIDQNATLFLNSFSTPATDQLWMLMSDKTVWIPAYAICAYFLFRRLGWKKALVVLVSVGIAFGLCDQFSTIVKHSVDRLRPSYSARMLLGGLNVLEGRGGFYGFFSAHAANAFALVMCLIIGFRNDRTQVRVDVGGVGGCQQDIRREALSRRCDRRDNCRADNRLLCRNACQICHPDSHRQSTCHRAHYDF